jgi:5-hydroxyisourate hydrolase-like protein (transthyretin family)
MPMLSTHVLDTEVGAAAVGVPVTLARQEGDGCVVAATAATDQDSRVR